MEHIAQSSSDLSYSLFAGPTNVEDLTIIDEAMISLGDFNLRFAIIGESHFLVLSRKDIGEVLFTEVLGCVADFNFVGETTHSFSYDELKDKRLSEGVCGLRFTDGFYSCGFLVRPFQPTRESINPDIRSEFVLHRVFPGKHYPATTIRVKIVSNHHIIIETTHDYPNDDGSGITFKSFGSIRFNYNQSQPSQHKDPALR